VGRHDDKLREIRDGFSHWLCQSRITLRSMWATSYEHALTAKIVSRTTMRAGRQGLTNREADAPKDAPDDQSSPSLFLGLRAQVRRQ
jgi:hypothetical protein